MMAKPMNCLELQYPMIQFLIINNKWYFLEHHINTERTNLPDENIK